MFTHSEDSDEMLHNVTLAVIRVYTVCKSKNDLQEKIQYFFLNYNWTSLDIYNGLAQVYYIKPVGRIH